MGNKFYQEEGTLPKSEFQKTGFDFSKIKFQKLNEINLKFEKNLLFFKKILNAIWKEFIYGGHLQSLGTSAIILVSSILLKIKITWDILLVSYLIFYPIYLYNRYKEIEIDYFTNPQRTEHLKIYIKKAPIILFSVILILIGIMLHLTNFRFIVFALLVLIFGFLYTIIFKKQTRRAPLFKNFYVAIFFTLVVIFPVIYYNYSLRQNLIISLLVLMIFVFLKSIMMQIFLDIKDIEADQKQGLLTFPIILGKEKALKFLKKFSILSTTIPIILAIYLGILPFVAVFLLLTIIFDFYCFYLAEKQKYSSYLLMSGMFLFWIIFIFIGEIVIFIW